MEENIQNIGFPDAVEDTSNVEAVEPNYQVAFDGHDAPTPKEEVAQTTEAETPIEGKIDAQQETQAETISEVVDIVEDTPTISDAQAVEEQAGTGVDWIDKLVNFHKETGGGLEEYQSFTQDFETMSDDNILKEYYRLTKPQYSEDDVKLLIDDKFTLSTDYEEGDEFSREDKLKLLNKKDELYAGKQFLNEQKSKHYADLKSGVAGAPEQYKEAVDFHNKAQESAKAQDAWRNNFIEQSNGVFSEDFKGFTFDGGDKKFRLNVGDPKTAMESQLDLNQVVGEFLGDDGSIVDIQGYHKAVWAARNADKIFKSAYEQGKADSIKERAQVGKNPSYNPQTTPKDTGQKTPSIKFTLPKFGF